MWYNPVKPYPRDVGLQKERTRRFKFPPSMSNSVVRSVSNFELADRNDPLLVRSCLTSHFISDPAVLAEFALDNCLSLVDASVGSFFLWDESDKSLILKDARGPGQQRMIGTKIRLREGVGGWIAQRGRSVLVKNVRTDVRFASMERAGRYLDSPCYRK